MSIVGWSESGTTGMQPCCRKSNIAIPSASTAASLRITLERNRRTRRQTFRLRRRISDRSSKNNLRRNSGQVAVITPAKTSESNLYAQVQTLQEWSPTWIRSIGVERGIYFGRCENREAEV